MKERKTKNLEPDQIMRRLLQAENPCDQRKGRDLGILLRLLAERWRQQVCILGAYPGDDGSLGLVFCLQVKGLVWGNDIPVVRDTFEFVLGIPRNYPLILPSVQFVGLIPYNPHVVHPEFIPSTVGLPTELQVYARQGAGCCCFLRHTQWHTDLSHNLALVLWQVSRILTLNKVFGEARSLNQAARDYVIHLQREDRLPLGPPLPLPEVSTGSHPDWEIESEEESEEDMIWLTDGSSLEK